MKEEEGRKKEEAIQKCIFTDKRQIKGGSYVRAASLKEKIRKSMRGKVCNQLKHILPNG